MKIPAEQKTIIFEGMLKMLDPEAIEEIEDVKKIEGRNLIYKGIVKDTQGRPILPGVEYVYKEVTTRTVNHKQKMGNIIEDAANEKEMTERLGEYLAKYAKDRASVIQSIPGRKSAANIRKSDN